MKKSKISADIPGQAKTGQDVILQRSGDQEAIINQESATCRTRSASPVGISGDAHLASAPRKLFG